MASFRITSLADLKEALRVIRTPTTTMWLMHPEAHEPLMEALKKGQKKRKKQWR